MTHTEISTEIARLERTIADHDRRNVTVQRGGEQWRMVTAERSRLRALLMTARTVARDARYAERYGHNA